MRVAQILSTGMPNKREVHRSVQKSEFTYRAYFMSPLWHLDLLGGFNVFGNFVDPWLRLCRIAW